MESNTASNANIAKVNESLLNELSNRIEASWPAPEQPAARQQDKS